MVADGIGPVIVQGLKPNLFTNSVEWRMGNVGVQRLNRNVETTLVFYMLSDTNGWRITILTFCLYKEQKSKDGYSLWGCFNLQWTHLLRTLRVWWPILATRWDHGLPTCVGVTVCRCVATGWQTTVEQWSLCSWRAATREDDWGTVEYSEWGRWNTSVHTVGASAGAERFCLTVTPFQDPVLYCACKPASLSFLIKPFCLQASIWVVAPEFHLKRAGHNAIVHWTHSYLLVFTVCVFAFKKNTTKSAVSLSTNCV